MYRYDEYDHALVQDRVAQFRRQVERRLAGELTEDQFRPLRLMNGLYLQLHAYMLRIAIPYGTLDSRQMRSNSDCMISRVWASRAAKGSSMMRIFGSTVSALARLQRCCIPPESSCG